MGPELPLGAFIDVVRGTTFTLFFVVAFFLMVIILLQEGKGGGLAGAFGGAGAETFGVKAGTVNKLTAWIATAFLGLALLHAGLSSASSQRDPSDTEVEGIEGLEDPKEEAPSEKGASKEEAPDGKGEPKDAEPKDEPKKDDGSDKKK